MSPLWPLPSTPPPVPPFSTPPPPPASSLADESSEAAHPPASEAPSASLDKARCCWMAFVKEGASPRSNVSGVGTPGGDKSEASSPSFNSASPPTSSSLLPPPPFSFSLPSLPFTFFAFAFFFAVRTWPSPNPTLRRSSGGAEGGGRKVTTHVRSPPLHCSFSFPNSLTSSAFVPTFTSFTAQSRHPAPTPAAVKAASWLGGSAACGERGLLFFFFFFFFFFSLASSATLASSSLVARESVV
mmetsp:Transcript_43343/g.73728  ORF Transcript_43343/g.73728 Transcript_43343/m.73728 type:complete len:242 (-) Transcript_43343:536-1261(-)